MPAQQLCSETCLPSPQPESERDLRRRARESCRCRVKRRIPGLSQAALPMIEVPDGLYLVRVERIQYRWDKQKPFYAVRLAVVEPARTPYGRP